GPCGTPAHGAGRAYSGRCLPPGVGGPPATHQGRTTSPQGHSGRGPRARGRRRVAPGAAGCPRARAPWATGTVPDKPGTAQTALAPALATRPAADTTRRLGCEPAPSPAR